MRVCVIGTGYVGLVTGACLAYIGHDVICVDNNEEKVKLMKSGQSPIHEPGLPEILTESIRQGKIEFTTDIATGVKHGEVLFIAVGTPSLADGRSDMRYVEAVARSIGESLTDGYRVIVNKSTVPIGSGDWVRMIVLDGMAGQSNDQIEFDVVSNPEFLREGVAVYDTFNPDRIVVGSDSDRALQLMQELYTPIIDRSFAENKTLAPVPVVVTDLNSAEMIKYAANAFLATKISFVNEIANICDRVGADVKEVARGIGLDSRIGSKFLQAGIGWGGSCFGKDVSALIYTAADYGYSTEILKACVRVNELQRILVVEKLQQALKILKGKTIGLLGMTFKPDTDDMRDAPALTLIDQLSRLGARVKAYDPLVSQSGLRQGFSNVIVETDLERLADGCDAVVLVTDWQEFLAIDYAKMLRLMHHPVIIDARNFLDGKALKALGYQYIGIGR
ncbi:MULTISPECIES: UDP-glucose dehydrogenase family protein [Pseudanabaena]|uniref:UDP-glucose 6-dehydrogenase n=2 Tax=Pseudanabaena TaxID=1152 RepID=L8N3U2_9CYAN|nr:MULTISPECIES: UDP-glucose/GDP-mannose dehydrogenase family protein [Pseudanabaena]ELS33385.1 nucleotide sugar dehydrogenase [Pseudanabaena biceps PCC 7429]MDG3494413.1 UDP-glucose/GDP-mannose dehydrogenase family protein [Pseudanabaena catenata USMAC16]